MRSSSCSIGHCSIQVKLAQTSLQWLYICFCRFKQHVQPNSNHLCCIAVDASSKTSRPLNLYRELELYSYYRGHFPLRDVYLICAFLVLAVPRFQMSCIFTQQMLQTVVESLYTR